MIKLAGFFSCLLLVAAPAAAKPARFLYVANDVDGNVDVYAIDAGHQLVRSIPIGGSRFRGISAHPGSARLFLTDSDANFVMALDLRTDATLWKRTYTGADACDNPDRLSVTLDGKTLFVPCKKTDRVLMLDTATGDVKKDKPLAPNPHNTFVGETGKYVYVSTRSGGPLNLFDPTSLHRIKEIGPFSSPIRPFSVAPDESWFVANLTRTLGFAVGQVETGKTEEYKQVTPAERTCHPEAKAPPSHGDNPESHGIAVRPGNVPGGPEVWFLDDAWGYLYVWSMAGKPHHVADIALFDDVTRPWGAGENRWVAFSADGDYAYPSDGSVIDASTRRILKDERIAPSEKLIEIDFEGDNPVRASQQNGGVVR
jgi:hypothetical protein